MLYEKYCLQKRQRGLDERTGKCLMSSIVFSRDKVAWMNGQVSV